MVTRSKKRKLNEMAGGAPPVGRQPLTKRKYVPDLLLQQFLEREIHHGHINDHKKVKRSKEQEIPFRKSKSRRYNGLIVRKELS